MKISTMIPVESSQLTAIGYDHETKTLAVEFKNATTYHYFAVPERVFEEFKSAPSKGAYFNQNVKWSFKYQRQ